MTDPVAAPTPATTVATVVADVKADAATVQADVSKAEVVVDTTATSWLSKALAFVKANPVWTLVIVVAIAAAVVWKIL